MKEKEYIIRGIAHVEIVTRVVANSEEEAEIEAQDREVNICIHGSEYADKIIPENEFVIKDGSYTHIDIDEIELFNRRITTPF